MNVHKPDDVRRRAEIDRLLSAANVQRLRGEFVPAEDSCRKVLELDAENLQARELLADMLYARGKLDEAVDEYKAVLSKDPKRTSVEEKHARTVLEIGEREHMKLLAQDMLENPAKYAGPRRNAGVAVLLSAVAPGFGHIYFGSFVKGLIILGVSVLSWVVVILCPGTQLFAQQVGDYLKHPSLGINTGILDPLAILFIGVAIFTYIYAVIDMAVMAGKAGSPT